MTGGQQPSYSPNVRTGRLGPFQDQSPELAYPSQTQIWAELRRISSQISSLVEAEMRCTQVFEQCLDTIETRLNALETTLADADGSRAKKVGGVSRGSSNKHPMLKVSRLRYHSHHASQAEVFGSP